MDCSPPGSSVHRDSPCRNTGVGYHALLQGIFPTQGLNPGCPHCGQILYCLSRQGSLRTLKSVAMPSSRRSPQCRNQTGISCIESRFFTSWATREAYIYTCIYVYIGCQRSLCVCMCVCVHTRCLVAQSCPTLCDSMDYSLPGSSVHGDSTGMNAGVGCHALLEGLIYLAVYLFLYKSSMVIQLWQKNNFSINSDSPPKSRWFFNEQGHRMQLETRSRGAEAEVQKELVLNQELAPEGKALLVCAQWLDQETSLQAWWPIWSQ